MNELHPADISDDMPVRDKLLHATTAICRLVCDNNQELYIPGRWQSDDEVYWGNSTDLDPGLGFVALLDRPYTDPGFKATQAFLVVYNDCGEAMMQVNADMQPNALDNDSMALWFAEEFVDCARRSGSWKQNRMMSLRSGQPRPHRLQNYDY